MAAEVSTIQSLKAVDAWIDVINANINGGVRTAFKASRLKFSGSNVDVSRTGNATSLPLQFPEPSLTTANTVIDFSQGAVTVSTEWTHLALQGDGFFKLRPLNSPLTPDYQVYYSRDGEFRWMKLPAGAGYYPSSPSAEPVIANDPNYTIYVLVNAQGLGVCARDAGGMGDNTNDDYVMHLIVNNATGVTGYGSSPSSLTPGMNLQQYLDTGFVNDLQIRDFDDRQSLTYSQYGSTVFKPGTQLGNEKVVDHTETTILSKSLEASNASMTQSVPELSLAQKLFSALTKVLQTKQTNVDGVLNLVR